MRRWLRSCGLCTVFLVYVVSLPLFAAETGQESRLVFDPAIRNQIREAIVSSQNSIDVEVFKLSDKGVIRDLEDSVKRGIKVRLILCPTQKENQKAATILRFAGAQVRWYPVRNKNQIMHLKMSCFDSRRIIFGSPNWTYWGLTLHHEGVLISAAAEILRQFQGQFQKDWEKSSETGQFP